MRRHLLLLLVLAITLPTMAVLVVSSVAMIHQEWAMEAVTHSYVEDLAENVASWLNLEPPLWGGRDSFSSIVKKLRVFSWGPSLPGWVAVITSEGKILMASPGVSNLAAIWDPRIPIGRAVEVRDRQGDRYTIAVYPLDGGNHLVIAAVAWRQLIGPMLRFGHIWPVLIVLMTLTTLIAVWAMWHWLILPLRKMVIEVDSLIWGKELPEQDDPQAVFELGRLRRALYRLAKTAIERDDLRNRYVHDVVSVQEEEKKRIARDIHDGPLQDITAMIQQMRLFNMNSCPSGETSHLKLAEEAAQIAVRDLRELCDELSPPWLDLGLEHALTELADRLSRHNAIDVTIDVDEQIYMPSEVVLAFFRIFQEGVSNAVHHGRATQVKGEVSQLDDTTVMFEIQDNGKGFEPNKSYEELRLNGHRGLANIMERITTLRGEFEVESVPGKGTLLRCLVPIVQDNDEN
ncbi:MAG: ATP-binding protein [Aminobacterium sp.]|jgi:signal transduction histidine kinase|uniref:sensor histidine kinase n=1 Tax=unclassified Aminobacterium TaxID=2685012 RepID=UPI001BD0A8C7|nr:MULTISPECIES: ATP-binding protein [unclassified Aminobacterium]MDD2207624.1 histidine kinase [Aminobacterium sp.]MDD3708369.1 histidine kinase [Aminobacterium sp.]MDD4229647.1 histidine kinase [Aminobacterium sp.]MDD4551614.1 histidine kinase [Aminobacterium sp.]MEA4878451.1 histidine kinase [Aminobacterium sp.]